MDTRGIKGGQQAAKDEAGKVSATAFAKYLKGISFPKDKKGIIQHLKDHKATQDILDMVEKFSDRKYTAVADVEKEFGSIKNK